MRNTAYADLVMEQPIEQPYARPMTDPDDIAGFLGRNLERIRKKYAGTQDEWTAKTGMAQGYLSRLENGRGWSSMKTVAGAIAKAGGNPLELFAGVKGGDIKDPDILEALHLLTVVDPAVKYAVLTMLRTAARAAAPKSAEGLE